MTWEYISELTNPKPHPYDDDPDWQKRGACYGQGPTLWFPPRGTPRRLIREAKRICAGCDIKQRCLEYALWHGERSGIWGGLTEKERRTLKTQITVVRKPPRTRTQIPRHAITETFDS